MSNAAYTFVMCKWKLLTFYLYLYRYFFYFRCMQDTYTCLEIGSRYATLRRGVEIAFSIVREPVSAAATATRLDGNDVSVDLSEATTDCTPVTISKSSSSADSARRVKSNLRWTTVKPARPTRTRSYFEPLITWVLTTVSVVFINCTDFLSFHFFVCIEYQSTIRTSCGRLVATWAEFQESVMGDAVDQWR